MNDYSPPDPKTNLCKYIFGKHNIGMINLSPRQLCSPWDWIYQTEQVMKDGETVTAYTLKGVKIPDDDHSPGHTFMLNEIRL